MSLKPPPHAAYLVAPEVREAIGMVLRRRGVPAVDSEDLTQDVIERALRTARPPESQGECVLLVRKIAKDLAIDTFKSARARGKYNAGPYENPDEAPARAPSAGEERDPIDAARQLNVVQQQIAVRRVDHEKPIGRQLGGEEIAQIGRVLDDKHQGAPSPGGRRETIGGGRGQ